jgi:hypothetical protein
MDPPELASEPPRSRIGAASNSAPHLRVLGGVMLGDAKVELALVAQSKHDHKLGKIIGCKGKIGSRDSYQAWS